MYSKHLKPIMPPRLPLNLWLSFCLILLNTGIIVMRHHILFYTELSYWADFILGVLLCLVISIYWLYTIVCSILTFHTFIEYTLIKSIPITLWCPLRCLLIFFLSLTSNFSIFMPFLRLVCFGGQVILVGVAYMSIDEGLFTGAWPIFQWLYHWREFFLTS